MTAKPEHPIALAHGCALEVADGGTQLTLTAGNGQAMIIRLTSEGPTIEMDVPQLTIRNRGALALEAGEIALRSRGDMVQEVGGNLEQRVHGHARAHIRDDLDVRCQSAQVEAHRGGLFLKASDDLSLQGLRVLHNVPSEQELVAQYEKAQTFGELMACPAFDPTSPRPIPRGEPKPASAEGLTDSSPTLRGEPKPASAEGLTDSSPISRGEPKPVSSKGLTEPVSIQREEPQPASGNS